MTQYFDDLVIARLAREGIISCEMARKAMPVVDLPDDAPPDPAAVRSIALVVILGLFALFFWATPTSAKASPSCLKYAKASKAVLCGDVQISPNRFFFITAGSSNDRA